MIDIKRMYLFISAVLGPHTPSTPFSTDPALAGERDPFPDFLSAEEEDVYRSVVCGVERVNRTKDRRGDTLVLLGRELVDLLIIKFPASTNRTRSFLRISAI